MAVPHDRRAFMGYFSGMGLGSTLFPGVLWGQVATGQEITTETIACAEEIAGLDFTAEERDMMVDDLKQQRERIAALREIPIPNSVAPAFHFSPLLPGMEIVAEPERPMVRARTPVMATPGSVEDLAFLPVTALSELVRRREVTSLELTKMYLSRLRKYDPVLHAVVTLTEERALPQAREADAEIAAGRYRGPLHGIPWGAKDLLAVAGYPTTWGATPYKDQTFDEDAEVVKRLDAAGAVLIAKLSLGALASGDVWFGGKTRNPWNTEQGSSGSSAGPGSATAAGLVGFSIGSETLGSISSPSTRNGVTGLRPTYGRVPRTGAMTLSWTMDKLGPMCRSVEDCALVFDAIRGVDGLDLSVRNAPFSWDATLKPGRVRIAFFEDAFERETDFATLDVLRSLGATLVPVGIPEFDYGAMRLILGAESAAAFDELTRSGRDELLVRQDENAWPNGFRASRFIPAVEYVNANRARTLAMQKWAELMADVEVIVTPTSGSSQLVATNFTGHPAVILPNGFREEDGIETPVSITFLGNLYGEDKVLSVAHAYQGATDFHLRYPEIQLP
ncbi:MAG TPA: amidase [Longimicrobiaceae bacterium]|nr:amidase [Longimicrobiaceae bacterium]